MMVERFGLGASSHVVELASNDGYLLQHLREAGDPGDGCRADRQYGDRSRSTRGSRRSCASSDPGRLVTCSADLGPVDLILGNNVLAHTPVLNDFVEGVKILLAPGGVTTFEFPHLFRLIAGNQFDTIYHEHFSYFSFFTVEKVFAAHGLTLFDVEELTTHGGSLRIFGRHTRERGAGGHESRRGPADPRVRRPA